MKLFRRLAHVASILAPLVLLACSLAASSQQTPKQGTQPNNAAPVSREQHERDVRALSDEIKAVREQAARDQQARTEHEHSWAFYEGAPIWSNWILAGIAFVAGCVAFVQFRHGRDAVRLTQRADVLVDGIGIRPTPLQPSTVIAFAFKNYGPTRAANVQMNAWLNFAEIQGREAPTTPLMILGANDSQTLTFEPLSTMMNQATASRINSGMVAFTCAAEVTYIDVFKKPHRTHVEGRYRPERGTWEVTRFEAD